jgi:hypothetical protein
MLEHLVFISLWKYLRDKIMIRRIKRREHLVRKRNKMKKRKMKTKKYSLGD